MYYYSVSVLKDIVASYTHIYQGIEFSKGGVYHHLDADPWSIAEFKADFDMALQNIGKGKWAGELEEFKYYRKYGRLQRIIIADILGIEDDELERLGFWSIPRLRGYSYYLMKCFLNGG